jgi:hypothetical protein|tara:strand:- start:185 stop:421 length:237 start_codon:yes stop_codon:yes gene_type:complete
MPIYTMKNINTGETEDMFMSIANMEKFVAEGTHTQVMSAPALVSHTGNIINKTSGDWKEHLTRCQKAAGTHIPNTIKV